MASKAPDGGYGWVIVFVSFMFNAICEGIFISFSVFIPSFLDYFQGGIAKTSLIISLQGGFSLFIGAVASSFVNKYGCRSVAVAGGLLSTSALVIGRFVPTIEILIIFFGVLTGAGHCLLVIAGYLSVSYYFEQRRALATGIASAGVGCGAFAMTSLVEVLLQHMDWKNASMIVAGVFLQTVPLAGLLRPIEITHISDDYMEGGVKINVTPESDGTSETSGFDSLSEDQSYSNASNKEKQKRKLHSSESHLATTSKDEHAKLFNSVGGVHNLQIKDKGALPHVSTSHTHLRKSTSSLSPLSRKDIFYSGNVHELQESINKSGNNLAQYKTEKRSEENIPKSGCAQAIKKMLDLAILKEPLFLLLCVAHMFLQLMFYIPFVYMKELTSAAGLPDSKVATLISIIGFTSIFGRLLSGILANAFKQLSALQWNNIGLLALAVGTFCAPLCKSFETLCIFAGLFGVFGPYHVALVPVILVDLVGLDRLTNAFGLLQMVRGASLMVGPPLIGSLLGITGVYYAGFIAAGLSFTLSLVVHLLLPCVKRCSPRRQNQDYDM